MSTPNPEQKVAIEHHGGVLLKAGAGSGKTFVLIEHLKYLVDQWIIEFKQSARPIEYFSSFLKSKFNKVTLMTFTKMAAGEISIRLFNKFQSQVSEVSSDLVPFWEVASESVDAISVSTIHGFCFKLIKQGLLKDVDAHDDMLDEVEFNLIIEKLFDQWVETEMQSNNINRLLIDLMIKDKSHLISSLQQIIGDPALRIMWREIDLEGPQATEENRIWEDLFQEHRELFTTCIDKAGLSEFKGKSWADFLLAFEDYRSGPIVNRDIALHYLYFFKQFDYKVPRSPTARGVDESFKLYYAKLKDFAALFKKYGEDFEQYCLHYNEVVMKWFGIFQQLVHFVDDEYSKTPGLTFADLEYIVWSRLKDADTVERVAQSYQYFIIDEFQDTSYIQFEIIEKLIQGDFSKLFCVGDVKQAIYGFRGGELGVFKDCQSKIPKVLSLKNNYRSLKDIINFNNNFFEFIFDRGLTYEGHDPHSVEVEYQAVPETTSEEGIVYPMELTVEDDGYFSTDDKVSNREVEYLESLRLLEQVKQLRTRYPIQDVAILYKRLKPSLSLIYLLLENDIGFTAQIKVPYATDPIMGIFSTLIQKRFDTNPQALQFSALLIQKYLELLGHQNTKDLASLFEHYESQEKYYGTFQAFLNLLATLGIANSNYANNLLYIESIINLAGGDAQQLLLLLQESAESSYSMTFQAGNSPEKVIIMTAHASKGLQFDHVLLGGIYTNDARMPSSPLFGKIPLSLQWSLELEGKKRFKTPQFIYEQQLSKKKDFSESKRLFYVACTRAKKSLGWVNIPLETFKMKTPQKGAWIHGLLKWSDEVYNQSLVEKTTQGSQTEIVSFNMRHLERLENKPPLFHIDSLGNAVHIADDQELMPISELSVTRLASIAECPRKFYLKNICKIADEDLDLLTLDKVDAYRHNDEEGLTSSSFSSNAGRGSAIHLKLSEIIQTGIEHYCDDLVANEIKKPVSWAVDNLEKYVDKYNLISEKSIKFELFGHMISGIPDLYLISKSTNRLEEIWDFKTGKSSKDKEKPYWFQLYSYAYASYQLGMTSLDRPIKIVLCYVDEKKIFEQNVQFSAVEKYLTDYWGKITRPWEINEKHCAQCSYQKICR